MPLPEPRPSDGQHRQPGREGGAVLALPVPRSGHDGPVTGTVAVPGGVLTDRDAPAFDVHLENFSGPFDLLLGLISRRRLELTEVSLAAVTDEFIAHLRRMLAVADDDGPGRGPSGGAGDGAALGQASGFLVVAATLLELKAARLLPSDDDAELDPDDLALVEARDLLFARLLQHRAYAQVGAVLRDRLDLAALRAPHPGGADPADATGAAQAHALSELVLGATPEQLAALAAQALTAGALAAGRASRAQGRVDVEHLHAPTVSVPEQVALLRERLVAAHAARGGAASTAVTFADLLDGDDDGGAAPATLVVGRFLAVLELYRRGEVDLAQRGPRDPLEVTWRGVVDLREERP